MAEEPALLIDTDSHVAEPPDLWEGEYMDPAYRGASPFRFVDGLDRMGRPGTRLYEGGKLLLEDAAYTAAAGVSVERLAKGVRYLEANPGGWDPAKRLADMDVERIDVQIVNPSSPGLRLGFVEDAEVAEAMCRAYNDWVADHCAAVRGRVYANMVLPWQAPDRALRELERVGKRDVFRGVVMRPAPEYPSGFVGDPAFDAIYGAIEERGLLLVFHSCAPDEGLVGPITRHYKTTRPFWHATFYGIMFGFPIEAWTAFAQLVFEGVLDRHPRLNVMLTESHGTWFVTALERMDEYARGGEALRQAFQMRLDLLPSEYFARQGFVVFEGDEVGLAFASEHICDSMVWALDYPHADATFPGGADAFRANLRALPSDVRRKLAWDNGVRAFGLEGAHPR